MGQAYSFRTQWHLPAPPRRVYDVLADVEDYPRWWPNVRSGRRIDASSGEIVCRSVLPYDLTMVMTRDVEDPVGLVLRARMSGDLVGTGQWTVAADGTGALATFEEQVDVANVLLRRAGRLFRPVLRYNHDQMMRGGEKGLRALLSPGG